MWWLCWCGQICFAAVCENFDHWHLVWQDITSMCSSAINRQGKHVMTEVIWQVAAMWKQLDSLLFRSQSISVLCSWPNRYSKIKNSKTSISWKFYVHVCILLLYEIIVELIWWDMACSVMKARQRYATAPSAQQIHIWDVYMGWQIQIQIWIVYMGGKFFD